jgi:hypothetical protein
VPLPDAVAKAATTRCSALSPRTRLLPFARSGREDSVNRRTP